MMESAGALFDWAAKRRDDGMIEAAFAETLDQPDFEDAALAAIRQVARMQCEVHVDDVLRICKLEPKHPNVWGSIWVKAIKRGDIVKPNPKYTRPSSDPKKHKHDYVVYRSGLFFGRKSA
jgi:hypothetical protein